MRKPKAQRDASSYGSADRNADNAVFASRQEGFEADDLCQDSPDASFGVARNLALQPFSRRAFFSLCAVTGVLSFQGTAMGGRMIAYADEAGAAHFVVYILSRYEVPVMAYNLSTEPAGVVEGVQVTITSRFNKKTLTVTTNADGFAPANIRDLSTQCDDDKADRYNFWGSIKAEKEGFRQFEVQRYFVEAGTPANEKGERTNTLQMPMQPAGDKPYVRMFTLDGADLQYSKNLDMRVWAGNNVNHDIIVQIAAQKANARVQARLMVNGSAVKTLEANASQTQPYLAELTFTDKWMNIFKPGDKLGLKFGIVGEQTYGLDCDLVIKQAEIPVEEGQLENVPVRLLGAPKNSSNQSDQLQTNPDDYKIPMPPFINRKGDSFDLSLGLLPYSIFFDVFGNFGVSMTLLQIDFIKDENGIDLLKGKDRLNTFVGLSDQATMGAFYDMCEKCIKSLDECRKATESGKPITGATPFTSQTSANFTMKGLGFASVHKSESTQDLMWKGDLAVSLRLSLSMIFTKQMLLGGWIPIFFSFDASSFIKATISVGFETHDVLDDVGWSHRNSKGERIPGFILVWRSEIGASFGLGISGLASIAIRGYGWLEKRLNCDGVKDKPYPHFSIEMGAEFQVISQLIFFLKKTISIVATPPCKAYDNWDPNGALEWSGEAGLTEEEDVLEVEDGDEVSDTDLQACVETAGIWVPRNDDPNTLVLTYEPIEPSPHPEGTFIDATVENLFNTATTRNPINGLYPKLQEVLWPSCYSNPRLRIVHTDTSSFKNDRAFLVRVAIVDVEVPATNKNAAFAQFSEGMPLPGSEGEGDYGLDVVESVALEAVRAEQEASEESLVVDSERGNLFVVPQSQAQTATNYTKVPRARITVSEWNAQTCTWGEAKVVDYLVGGEITAVERLNAHDVDFDVDLHDGGLLIAIGSFDRPRGVEKASVQTSISEQYISLVKWDIDEQKVTAAASTRSLRAIGRSLFHPRLLMQCFDDGSGSKLHAVVYSYACTFNAQGYARDAAFAATVFDDMKEGFSGHRFSRPVDIIPNLKDIATITNDLLLEGSFEVSCPDRAMTKVDPATNRFESTVLISWSHPKSKRLLQPLSFVLSETYSVVLEGGAAKGTFTPFVTTHDKKKLEQISSVSKLGCTDQRGVFGFSDMTKKQDAKPLSVVMFDKSDHSLSVMENVADSTRLMYFSSFNGRRLYCVREMDGTTPALPEDVQEAIKSGAPLSAPQGPYNSPDLAAGNTGAVPVKLYQLLEARWVDELKCYYDFYPIAQLDSVPDNIGVIAVNSKRTDFVMAAIKNIDENKADILHVAVPVVMSAICENAHPCCPFAAPGDTCWYTVDVSNVGTAPITELTMTVGDALHGKFDTQTYSNLAECAQSSPDDVRKKYNDEGDPVVLENGLHDTDDERNGITLAGILWPGKTRTFKFGFKMPEGNMGSTEFSVYVTGCRDGMDDDNAPYEPLNQVAASLSLPQDDGASVPLFAPDDYVNGEEAAREIPTLLSEEAVPLRIEAGSDRLQFDDVWVRSQDYTEADWNDHPGNTGSGGGASGGDKMPDTGDTAPLLSLGALAVGAAATAVGLYEKRRAENEGR